MAAAESDLTAVFQSQPASIAAARFGKQSSFGVRETALTLFVNFLEQLIHSLLQIGSLVLRFIHLEVRAAFGQ